MKALKNILKSSALLYIFFLLFGALAWIFQAVVFAPGFIWLFAICVLISTCVYLFGDET